MAQEYENDYNVTDETAAFYDCISDLYDFRTEVSTDVTRTNWGHSNANGLMREFDDKLEAVMDELWKFVRKTSESSLRLDGRINRV